MLLFANGAGIVTNQALSETALSIFFGILPPTFAGFSQHLLRNNTLPEVYLLPRLHPLRGSGNYSLGGASFYTQRTITTEVLFERFIVGQNSIGYH